MGRGLGGLCCGGEAEQEQVGKQGMGERAASASGGWTQAGQRGVYSRNTGMEEEGGRWQEHPGRAQGRAACFPGEVAEGEEEGADEEETRGAYSECGGEEARVGAGE